MKEYTHNRCEGVLAATNAIRHFIFATEEQKQYGQNNAAPLDGILKQRHGANQHSLFQFIRTMGFGQDFENQFLRTADVHLK